MTVFMRLNLSIRAHIRPQPPYKTYVSLSTSHTHTHRPSHKQTHTSPLSTLGSNKAEGGMSYSHTRREKLASHEAQCFHPRRGRNVASFTVEWERPGAFALSSKCPPPTTTTNGTAQSLSSLTPAGRKWGCIHTGRTRSSDESP